MSVWLTPELKPVVGGTYFPPDDRYFGRPGFMTILQHVVSKVIINLYPDLGKKTCFIICYGMKDKKLQPSQCVIQNT